MTNTQLRQGRRWTVLAVLGTCFLVVMMDNTILNVALPTIQRSLSASNSQLQWAVDAYILVYAALMFTAGVLADALGRRRILVVGLVVFAVASALSSYASTPEELIAWRAVMGLGGAVVPPATLAIIKDSFPSSDQGKALGVWSAIGGLSVAFGPILGGALLERFWWGSVFIINVPIVAACLLLILWRVPESRAQTRARMDLPGLLLSAAAIAALVYGIIRGGETSEWLRADTLGLIVLGLVLAVVLVAVERRTAHPAMDVSLFKNPAFTAGTTSIAMAFFALTGGTFLLVFYIQMVRDNSPLELGLILLPVAVGSVASALSSGAMSKSRGPRFTITLGLLLLAASLAGIATVGADTALWPVEIYLGLAGLGMGFVMGATTTLVMLVVDADKAGSGAAVNNTLRQVGAALGVAVMGSLYSVVYRDRFDDLPASGLLPDAAHDSLSGTATTVQAVSESPNAPSPSELESILSGAQDAFMDAQRITMAAAAAVLVAVAVVGMLWLPRRLPEPEGEHS
ncbi:MFS transporter [Glycomyces arizonensis]|uniref:MFS transporter n=1 Tax=Glycomyces arizonensis TaxID=256035 RepID=UPI00041F2063|nr:MFS transporter [Glycomyces arizonensis]